MLRFGEELDESVKHASLMLGSVSEQQKVAGEKVESLTTAIPWVLTEQSYFESTFASIRQLQPSYLSGAFSVVGEGRHSPVTVTIT